MSLQIEVSYSGWDLRPNSGSSLVVKGGRGAWFLDLTRGWGPGAWPNRETLIPRSEGRGPGHWTLQG